MALSVGRGRSGYNNTQQGKINILQSKASQEKKAKHWDWVEEGCVRTRTPERQSPGQKYPSQSWGALL